MKEMNFAENFGEVREISKHSTAVAVSAICVWIWIRLEQASLLRGIHILLL